MAAHSSVATGAPSDRKKKRDDQPDRRHRGELDPGQPLRDDDALLIGGRHHPGHADQVRGLPGAYLRRTARARVVWAANDVPGRKYRNVTIVVDRSRDPGNWAPVLGTTVFGMGTAPTSPAIGAPRALAGVDRAAASRTAATWTSRTGRGRALDDRDLRVQRLAERPGGGRLGLQGRRVRRDEAGDAARRRQRRQIADRPRDGRDPAPARSGTAARLTSAAYRPG